MDALSQLMRLVRLETRLDLRCQFAPGFAIDHDRAPPREIVFHLALAGRCLIEVEGGQTITVETGDFVALPDGRAHRVRTPGAVEDAHRLTTIARGALPLRRSLDGDVELDLLCGRFAYDSSAIDTLFEALPGVLHVPLSRSSPHVDLARLVALIRTEVDADGAGVAAIVASLTTVLFTLALRIGSERDALPPGLLRLIGDHRLAKAAQAMLDDPAAEWTLEQLADMSAMSRATFARRFGDAAGTTPGALLLEVRMSKAADLLRRTRRGVADIGLQVGYQSEAAFSRAFRRVTDLSPAAFRKAGESRDAAD